MMTTENNAHMSLSTDGGSSSTDETDDEYEEYADLGATTSDAMEIAESSMDRVRELVPDETLEDRLRQKAVHATGDPEFQHLVRFAGDPVRTGARAVLSEQPIVTDITMVKAGITGRGHQCPVKKAIGNGSVYDDAIAAIGNAPTAALALADCIESGTRPAAVVATPVGFIKAAESRNRIRAVATEYGVPAITTVGRRGGSGLAAGLTNELVHVASDVRDGEVTLENAATEANRHDHREAEQ
jgi:precorrin-8X/cobalt-precorrin-8 methylmutase